MEIGNDVRSGNSQLLGAIVTHLNTPISSHILAGAEIASGQFGYGMMVTQSMNKPDQRIKSLDRLRSHGVEGILVSSAYSQEHAVMDYLAEMDIPRVVFEASSLLPNQPKKRLSDFQNAYALTSYLIENGCKRIAHVSLSLPGEPTNLLSGYKEALRFHDLQGYHQADADFKAHYSWSDLPETLLSMQPQPDGILFTSNAIAALAFNPPVETAKKNNELWITGRKSSIDKRNEKIVEIGKFAATMLIWLCQRKSAADRNKLCDVGVDSNLNTEISIL